MSSRDKMKVEIWSDVMCPFCYIGKRKFENALKQFSNSGNVEIEWKSFQLSPHMKTAPDKSVHQFLSEHKGISLAQATSLNDRVTEMARQVGLDYRFDKAVPANSFKAHRFTHFAKKKDVQGKAEEALFNAYFTEGKNIDDTITLMKLGEEIGLDPLETKQVLESDEYSNEVRHDIHEAREIGVNGVPFFVFNRRYAVSGAQDPEAFLQVLKKSYDEWGQGHK